MYVCVCVGQCEAHLGYVYDDGPPPLGLRYQINSASLDFEKRPWFEQPAISRTRRRYNIHRTLAQEFTFGLFNELLKDEKAMGMGSY